MKSPKTNPEPKKGRGRPALYMKKRCVAMCDVDFESFKSYGYGSLANGVRRAAAKLRELGYTPGE
jgi:hypothetical protein